MRRAVDEGVQHLIIGTSLPWLLPHAIHDIERWNETLNVRHEGRWRGRLAEKLRQAADLEHWAAFGDSFERLGRALASVARGEHGPAPATALVLSGDVHHAYAAELVQPRRPRRARAPADGLPAAQPGAAPDPGGLPHRLEPVGEERSPRPWRGWPRRSRAAWSGRSRRVRSSATRSGSWCCRPGGALPAVGDRAGPGGAEAGAGHAAGRSLTGWTGMTKPAPGPDQPPIPVRLVTFNTHHGVGRGRPARPAPAGHSSWPRRTPTSSACRRSTGTSATAARTSTRRCCSPARWTCSWRGGRRSTSRARAGSPAAVRQRAAVPAADPDQRRAPAARGGRAAQRAAHDARTRRRHAVGDQHAPEHRSG